MAKPVFVAESFKGNIPVNWYPVPDDQRGVILRRTHGSRAVISPGSSFVTNGHTVIATDVLALHVVISTRGAAALEQSPGTPYPPGYPGDFTRLLVLWRCNPFLDCVDIHTGEKPANTLLIEYDETYTETGYIWQMWVDPMVTSCQIEHCDSHYVVCDGTTLWSIKRTSPHTVMSQAFNATSIATADGYCIAAVKDTGQFRISALNDFFTWDPLDYGTAEGDADNLLRVLTDHRELWAFGEKTTEIYYNSGSADFPYARAAGGFIEHGIAAWASATKLDNQVYWLSDSRQVLRASGYQPQIVSTRKLDEIMHNMDRVDDAIGFSMVYRGHSFYWLSFPSAKKTYVFDAATGMWHQRAVWDWWHSGGYLAHYAKHYAYMRGKHLVGGTLQESNLGPQPAVFEMNDQYLYDNFTSIHRTVESPEIVEPTARSRVYHSSVEVEIDLNDEDVESIVETVADSDDGYQLEWSDDGGKTWSNQRMVTGVELGENRERIIFRRLGQSRRRIYRFVTAAERVEVILGMYLQSAPGGK